MSGWLRMGLYAAVDKRHASVTVAYGDHRRRGSGQPLWSSVRILALAAAIGLLLAAAGCAGSRAGPPRIADARRLLVPAHGALFGAWVKPAQGFSAQDQETAVAALEQSLGRELAIDGLYVAWNGQMPLTVAGWDLRHGVLPMISWQGANTRRITDGIYDVQIRARARQLRSLHRPVMLRWFYEMDGRPNRRNAGSPASFIAAWRHVYRIFASVGATNVLWVWCPNASDFFSGKAQRYYPGSSYVSWIGADGYNWAPVRPHSVWRSFGQIFSAFYQWGVSTGKPLLIGEYGVLEGARGQKAAWFAQADRQLKTRFPAIRALVYFDSSRQNPNFGGYFNWKVTSSPSAWAAFRAFASDPYFSAQPTI